MEAVRKDRTSRRTGRPAIAMIAAAAGPRAVPRFVWNVSGSVPTGLYRVRPAPDLTIATLAVAYPTHRVLADRAVKQRPERTAHPPRIRPREIGASNQRIRRLRAPLIGRQGLALPLAALAIGSRQPAPRNLDLDAPERAHHRGRSVAVPVPAGCIPGSGRCRSAVARRDSASIIFRGFGAQEVHCSIASTPDRQNGENYFPSIRPQRPGL